MATITNITTLQTQTGDEARANADLQSASTATSVERFTSPSLEEVQSLQVPSATLQTGANASQGVHSRDDGSANSIERVSDSEINNEVLQMTSHGLSEPGSAQSSTRRPSTLLEIGSANDGPVAGVSQGKPPEIANLLAEVILVLMCSMGQLLFTLFFGNINVNQLSLLPVLGISSSQAPWLVGAFLLANGLSVVISGGLADLAGPKAMMVGAFAWLTLWNVIGCFSLTPSRAILFFVVRGMQGLSVGILVSASMSVLGRIYKPGLRGALSKNPEWIFGSSAILCGLSMVAAYFTIPAIEPAADRPGQVRPSMRNFDYLGASAAVAGCGCLLFGLTQGAPSGWSAYTYALIMVGVLFFVGFYLVERQVARPLIDNRLWSTPGFAPLALSYFLGFGSYVGAWQFYAIRFWLTVQKVSPLTVALYLLPNPIVGVLAAFIVSRTLHLVPGHWILTASMVAYALGPVFFLPQTANTSYWALSMPGIVLVTFGPDLSFAAASIFITSSVSKSFQGSAGSVLVTIQNLSAAIMTAIGDTIGQKVTKSADAELDLESLKAIWWFAFAAAILAAAVCAVAVRIPKSEEKEHIS